jgi:hypothetical protein
MEAITLEGTWEEILQHAPQLAGQRVKVTILSPPSHPKEATALSTLVSSVDPLSSFIGAVSHSSLATDIDTELYGC